MLYLYIGRKKDYFLSGDGVFDNLLDDSFILKDFSRKVIKEIDKSEVIDKYCVKSPILGGIAPTYISGGSKTLISIMYSDYRFYLEAMGDNCLPFLKEICDLKDVYMCTTTMRPLFDCGFKEFYVENTNELVTNARKYLELEMKYGGINA